MKDSIFIQPQNHDVSCTFVDDLGKIRTFEYDRWSDLSITSNRISGKNSRLRFYTRPKADEDTQNKIKEKIHLSAINLTKFLNYIKEFKNVNEIKKCYVLTNGSFIVYDELRRSITNSFPNIKIYLHPYHHYCHAAVAYYQAPKHFEKCFVFSYDGTGFTKLLTDRDILYADQVTKKELDRTGFLFYGSSFNKKHKLKYVTNFMTHWGGVYTEISKEIKIKWPDGSIRHLSNKHRRLSSPGKFMGLGAYGNIKTNLVQIYEDIIHPGPVEPHRYKKSKNLGRDTWRERQNVLINLLKNTSPDDILDHAASFQQAFENKVIDTLIPIIKRKKIPLILTGGCALNVLVNQRIAEECKKIGVDVFVCNNPSDSGLSLGQLFLENPHNIQTLTYSGLPMMDDLKKYYNTYSIKEHSISDVVEQIKNEKIIGCAHDNSELGPRALGNRSIICKPSSGMKDILNAKIKFREWFRPFAPVCRYEDKDKYFNNAFESPYMSFSPTVKKQYRDQLASITHEDNTARLQTVTRQQHQFFYDILTEMEKQNMIPVLLNTSFNIKGKPILTSYSRAFEALEDTQLDYLYLDKKYLISKEDKK